MRAIQLALRASRVSPQSIYLRQSRVMFSSEGKGILSDPEQQVLIIGLALLLHLQQIIALG